MIYLGHFTREGRIIYYERFKSLKECRQYYNAWAKTQGYQILSGASLPNLLAIIEKMHTMTGYSVKHIEKSEMPIDVLEGWEDD